MIGKTMNKAAHPANISSGVSSSFVLVFGSPSPSGLIAILFFIPALI
jgi:hypothetical protein